MPTSEKTPTYLGIKSHEERTNFIPSDPRRFSDVFYTNPESAMQLREQGLTVRMGGRWEFVFKNWAYV